MASLVLPFFNKGHICEQMWIYLFKSENAQKKTAAILNVSFLAKEKSNLRKAAVCLVLPNLSKNIEQLGFYVVSSGFYPDYKPLFYLMLWPMWR